MKTSRALFLTLCLAAVGSTARAQSDDDLEKKSLARCQALATEMNKTHKAGIRLEGITPLVTWRAACADKPPTGPGNVTALCQGIRVTAKGEQGVFFWQKSNQGKLNNRYFLCTD